MPEKIQKDIIRMAKKLKNEFDIHVLEVSNKNIAFCLLIRHQKHQIPYHRP